VPKTVSEQTERLKRHWEKEAPTYDRRMSFFERVLFGDGREWVCSRASGEVLEVAVGTGRNFPFYPARCAANRHRPQPTHARDRLEEG
jgi:hypothetical protein